MRGKRLHTHSVKASEGGSPELEAMRGSKKGTFIKNGEGYTKAVREEEKRRGREEEETTHTDMAGKRFLPDTPITINTEGVLYLYPFRGTCLVFIT